MQDGHRQKHPMGLQNFYIIQKSQTRSSGCILIGIYMTWCSNL